MNKVKCTNNHFFDADRFNCCPICGGAIAGKSEKRKKPAEVEPIRQSRLDPMDKTALMDETETKASRPVTGQAGGIKWHFWSKPQSEPAAQPQETVEPPKQPQEPVEVQEAVPSVQPEEKPVNDDAAEEQLPVRPVMQPRQDAPASSLTQAVAATGHGLTSALPKTVAYYDLAETDTEPPTAWLVCVKGVYQGQAFACKSGRNRVGRNPNCNVNLVNDTSVTREPHAVIIYDPKQRKFYLQNGSGDGLVYLNGSLLFAHEELNAYDQVQIGNAEFLFFPLCGERFAWEDYIS